MPILILRAMRRKYKQTVTTFESHEIVTLRHTTFVLCPHCPTPSRMLTPAEAALQTNVSQRVIYRWIEAGLIHFAETADGGLSVCLYPICNQSLKLSVNKKGPRQ